MSGIDQVRAAVTAANEMTGQAIASFAATKDELDQLTGELAGLVRSSSRPEGEAAVARLRHAIELLGHAHGHAVAAHEHAAGFCATT
ncbi:hypothetical protein [Actinokineospora sp. UTMC 2448]|uniref:hypothetical protein n=1 Tax=Actinokineospora sp. UTMC 2448 TaxID=2268449 RepID=UPI002164CC5C|nr:hypothetical protein [Actinokineospora sp. UTMC 2448]